MGTYFPPQNKRREGLRLRPSIGFFLPLRLCGAPGRVTPALETAQAAFTAQVFLCCRRAAGEGASAPAREMTAARSWNWGLAVSRVRGAGMCLMSWSSKVSVHHP